MSSDGSELGTLEAQERLRAALEREQAGLDRMSPVEEEAAGIEAKAEEEGEEKPREVSPAEMAVMMGQQAFHIYFELTEEYRTFLKNKVGAPTRKEKEHLANLMRCAAQAFESAAQVQWVASQQIAMAQAMQAHTGQSEGGIALPPGVTA